MTTTQLLVVIGTVWIAPHVNPSLSIIVGLVTIIIGSSIGLGWV